MDLSTIPWGEIGGTVAAVLAGVALLRQRRTEAQVARTADAAQKVEGAATIINGYDQLVKTLQARLAQVEAELAALRAEQAKMRAENDALRAEQAKMRAENDALRQKVRQLEEERSDLLAQLAKLSALVNGKGARL